MPPEGSKMNVIKNDFCCTSFGLDHFSLLAKFRLMIPCIFIKLQKHTFKYSNFNSDFPRFFEYFPYCESSKYTFQNSFQVPGHDAAILFFLRVSYESNSTLRLDILLSLREEKRRHKNIGLYSKDP